MLEREAEENESLRLIYHKMVTAEKKIKEKFTTKCFPGKYFLLGTFF